MMQLHSKNEEETKQFGDKLAAGLKRGTVVALNGPLGAGKTRLVQAIAAAFGVPRDAVTSPTFVLVNEYTQGRLPIYHFDAYRIRDLDEFAELGPEEYFYGQGVCLVEWAERVPQHLPSNRLEIDIEVVGADERLFKVTPLGDTIKPIFERISL